MKDSSFHKYILCAFSFCLLFPKFAFAQACGATEGNTAVFCKSLAAFCGLNVQTLTTGNPDAVTECYQKLEKLSRGSKEDQELARKVLNDCFEDSSEDFMKESFEKIKNTGTFEENVMDAKVEKDNPTTQRADMSVTNELSKSISDSINALMATTASRVALDAQQNYNNMIENYLDDSVVAEDETEDDKPSESSGESAEGED